MRILLIEDNQEILDFLNKHLPAAGFAVDVAQTGAVALSLFQVNKYDIVILDLGLPDMSGESVCATIHSKESAPPVLILTVVNDSDEKVRLLNAGADDYLVKPFSFAELVARIHALLRRSNNLTHNVLVRGNLELDVSKQRVRRGKKEVRLTTKEFMILEHLLRHQENVVTKAMLIEHVWNASANPFSEALETHVANLRKKLGQPTLINTIHGRGYSIA